MSTIQSNDRRTLTASEVMAITRHRNRSSFWQFVHRAGLPCIRLNSRNIVFDAQAVDAWLLSRSTDGKGAAA